MPAKWQQWMPFHIDRFKASPSVQAMHPAARAGYLYLLSCQWQSEDCTISSDPLDLAEQSGLGDELWAIHGARILRKFAAVTVAVSERSPSENGTVTVNRLRNIPCFEEWREASRVFFARKNAADRTNSSRSPNADRTVTARGPSRSADTITGTVTITNTKEQKATPKAAPSSFTLPIWIHPGTWQAYEEMRKRIRAPLTSEASRRIISRLEKLRLEGHDPEEILSVSIERSYRGIWPPNVIGGNGTNDSKLSKYEQMRRDDEELFGRSEEDSPGVN